MNEDTRKQIGPDEFAKTGDHVIVVDEYGFRHNGLVVNGWGGASANPCLNVVYVVANIKKTDGYGRQKEHLSSCSHAKNTSAPGRYWYKDAAWQRETERDANIVQVEGENLDMQEFKERAEELAWEKNLPEYKAAMEGEGRGNWDAFWPIVNPRRAEFKAKWEKTWKEYNSRYSQT